MRKHNGVNNRLIALASVAVVLGDRECSIEGETALIVGANEMGRFAAETVSEWADHVIVATRTLPHAEHVADSIEAETSTIGLNAMETAVAEARVVVSATGSNAEVLDVETLAEAGETTVIDIARPQDAPTGADRLPSVSVYDADSFEALIEGVQAKKRRVTEAAEQLAGSEFDHLLTQYKRKRADRVISAMHESAERIKTAEVHTAMTEAEFDESQREVVESMADTIVSQLLAAPTESLRSAAEESDWSTIQTAVKLFDSDFGPKSPEFLQSISIENIPEGMRDPTEPAVLERLAED